MGVDVNVRSTGDVTALMFAVSRGLENIAKLLIDAGADVNIRVTDISATPSAEVIFHKP